MPERFKVVCIPYKVLYKCSALPFLTEVYIAGIGIFDLSAKKVRRQLKVAVDLTNSATELQTNGLLHKADGHIVSAIVTIFVFMLFRGRK